MPEFGSWGGGLGDSGNARKKKFFFNWGLPLDQKSWVIQKNQIHIPLLIPREGDGEYTRDLGSFRNPRAVVSSCALHPTILPPCTPNLCSHALPCTRTTLPPPWLPTTNPTRLHYLCTHVSNHIGLHIVCRYDLDLLEVSLDISCFDTTTHPKHTIQIIFYKLPLSCASSKALRGQGYYWGRSDETVSWFPSQIETKLVRRLFCSHKNVGKGQNEKLKQLSLWWLFVCSLLSCRINPLGSIPHLNNVHSSLLPRRVCTFVGGSSKAISILETLHTHTQGWEDNPLKSHLVSGVRFIFHVGCRNYALLWRKTLGLKIRWCKKLDI